MQIFVNCKSTHLVEVAAETSVEDVYQLVAAREGLCAGDLYLCSQGRVLTTGSLAANGVSELSVVEASVRMLGGKVHGSLARAGKVRGQTPKVEKGGDKKKSKTGMSRRVSGCCRGWGCVRLCPFVGERGSVSMRWVGARCSPIPFYTVGVMLGCLLLLPRVSTPPFAFRRPGRCKRRLQYNKRFINVVVGLGGKKKGPNAQAVPT